MSTQQIEKVIGLLQDDGSNIELWAAEFFTGVIVADGIIDPAEQPYLESLLKSTLAKPDINRSIRKILEAKKPPQLETIEVEPDIAKKIFKCALEICCCDDELHYTEIRFIKEAGESLGIPPLEVHVMIDQSILALKATSFDELLTNLNEKERYWFAIVILKVIFADEKVSNKEFLYFSDIYDLTEDADSLFNEMQKEFSCFDDVYELTDEAEVLVNTMQEDSMQLTLDKLPKMNFDSKRSGQILKYLLTLTMVDKDFDEREVDLIQKIANLLEYDRQQLKELIESTKNALGLLS
ncbi:MAG: hypothetical protein HQM14_18600 [SAR324 cluster bacterium]|nr:hypothetical protein [SAR324 cluster bacterium]